MTRTPRLLMGVTAAPMSLQRHLQLHGERPVRQIDWLRSELDAAGLRGRGGAAFPLARKLDAVLGARGRPIVVVNGCEGEPLSSKDRVLLGSLPHLVLDGAMAVADAVGADDVLFAVEENDTTSIQSLKAALGEWQPANGRARASLVCAPFGFVTGQESALVNWLNTGKAIPTRTPPRVSVRGVRGRPTLVSNAETVAHAALIARHGARWFAEAGTPQDPGTALVTLEGAVARPGVYEIEHGLPLRELLHGAGGVTAAPSAFLIGGYAGCWVRADDARLLGLSREGLRATGGRLGAGVIVALPSSACPVAEVAGVTRWLANQTAGQCGPCVHGLAAIGQTLDEIQNGMARTDALSDLARWADQIIGRGACAHPDGAALFLSSALHVFEEDLVDHARHGRCDGCNEPQLLRTPHAAPEAAGAR